MKIKFIKAAHAFAVLTNIAGERPKIVFESAKLYLRKIKPHPQILANVATNLSRGAAVHYPIARTEVITIPAAAGRLDISKEQLFYGRIPKILVSPWLIMMLLVECMQKIHTISNTLM